MCQDIDAYNPLRVIIKDSTLYEAILKDSIKVPAISSGLSVHYRPSKILKYPVRIALDPGHVASNWEEAKIEGHYIENKRENIKFYESELTMATALLLKERLEGNGFLVYMTRRWGEGAFGVSYTDWYKREFKRFAANDLTSGIIDSSKYQQLMKASKKEVFESYYRVLDIQERARKINLFKPDISLIIHYNASEFDSDKVNSAPITDFNYSVFFVPGGFTITELSSPTQEHDVFRLVSTNDLDRSIKLANYVSNEFEINFKVPSLTEQKAERWAQDIPWLNKYVSPTPNPFVLGRNLLLTRLIQGPLVYGEPFLQNNRYFITELNRKDLNVYGLKVSPLIQTAANSYYLGILRYLKEGKFSVIFE